MADMEKFKRLVHYVCAQSPDPTKLGAVKLNKILWFAEREAYLRLGESISGAKFVKRQFGPVPSTILRTLSDLQDEGAIVIRESAFNGYLKRDFIPLAEASLEDFTADQVSIVNRAIHAICYRHTAMSISDRSHDEAWELADIGEEIPFNSAFGVRGEVTEEHVAWAQQQIEAMRGVAA